MDSESGSFGAVLRRLREAAALSQEALAARAGLSVRGISDLERGVRRLPHLSTVNLLADALALAPEDRAALLAASRPDAHRRDSPASPSRPYARPPHPLTRLVGREKELRTLERLLDQDGVRLVTLTGTGGIGKTRLALELAAQRTGRFTDGVVFVDLAPLRDPDAVLTTVGAALGTQEAPPRTLAELLAAELGPRQCLLLIDNFEHLLPAAPVVTALLEVAPRVKALVTSRGPLGVRGEHEFSVQPLGLPAATELSEEGVLASGAVALFAERARAKDAGFALAGDAVTMAAEIVTRLDGLPLAIELAAAWARTHTVRDLAAALEHRLPLLTTGARDAPARHRTMRDAIAWSYHLLTPDEQALFRRLAVFTGGFFLEAAEAINAAGGTIETLERVTALADQGLVGVRYGDGARRRYAMLETIREFAHDELVANGEESLAGDRHVAIAVDLVERAVAYLHGPEQTTWLNRLETEHNNLRAALAWTIAQRQAEPAARLGAGLWLFWLKRGHWSEGRAWLRQVLAFADAAPAALHAEALMGAGNLAGIQGDLADAFARFDASIATWRVLGDDAGLARPLSMKAVAAVHSLDFTRAIALLTEALPLFELPRDEAWAAHAVSYLGFALVGAGDVDAGVACAEEGLARQIAIGESWAAANAYVMLGEALVAKGAHHRAAAVYAEGLRGWAEPSATGILFWPLLGLANIANAAERPLDAARLIGFHEAMVLHADAALEPYYRQLHETAAGAARERLTPEAFAAAHEDGLHTPIACIPAEAIGLALELARGT